MTIDYKEMLAFLRKPRNGVNFQAKACRGYLSTQLRRLRNRTVMNSAISKGKT